MRRSDPEKRARFYRERDRRTAEYDPQLKRWLEEPVGVVIGQAAAESRAGQVALLALVNMIVRLHRNVTVGVPRVPLLARPLVPAHSLDEAVEATARAIDPFGRLVIVDPGRMRALPGVAIGMEDRLPLHIGWNGLQASIAASTQAVGRGNRSLLGASLAACLGAAGLLQLVTAAAPPSVVASLADFGNEPAGGEQDAVGLPIDVGDVLLVGAGAVASGLLYWLREFGVIGRWLVVDRDGLFLHNTNRSIGTLVEQTEWPGGTPEPKAEVGARLIGAEARVAWYHQWLGTERDFRPALVLPLANDHDVRRLIGLRGEPLLVHATTSRDWTAELHRHTMDVDECIACRFPGGAPTPAFACSTAGIETGEGKASDAALPFLSGAAGLLLLRALTMHRKGDLVRLEHNIIRLGLGAYRPGFGRFSLLFAAAREGCKHVPSPVVRAILRGSSEEARWQKP